MVPPTAVMCGEVDGTCAVFNTRKEASVQGWTLWQTQGMFKNVGAVVQSLFFLVQRTLNGAPALVFEQAIEGAFMDCSTGAVTPLHLFKARRR